MSQQDMDEVQRRQEDAQGQRAMAEQSARQAEELVEEMSGPDFIDKFRDPDVPEWLEEELGAELSGVWPLANETAEDHRRHRWLNENKADRVIAEQNAGRLCRGPLLELAQNVNTRPDETAKMGQTDWERRQTREAEGVKTAMQSLGKDGRGVSALTEATAVYRREQGGDDSSGGSKGRVRKTLGKVFG
ncbi:hypothetical protein SAMN06269185_1066 [Natronoarchaeum philippinense]|uniref:Uncharacterized protein n=1 Tax=Natronoarchaeum philippinense TaxID=558529 RepID=A0A285N9N7_NATPI|nr:hypothetical protein [Natronoarchaeum philippinense]SNZ06149.1 hypothetical protein SAMN06269185_1066 [Natronoarchaeum philippinense]